MATIEMVFFSAWALWCAFNIGVVLLGAVWALPHQSAYFNGFRIIIPPDFAAKLTPEELVAVIEHERGHQAHSHVWYNLLCVCLFAPVTPQERMDQELEADDWVGNRMALASALRKTSSNPQDLFRAERLERRWMIEGSAGRGQPNARDGREMPH